ncbi:ferritin-2 heavy chain [Musca vetustissima]|uniref:ferritin-2 heavy chain n=1 Tax=Musca vetustissima TaxID=27455 RepID=UPI002AB7CEAC|nr:ferritin-2 heavy chain [Musca vetustissima]
MKSLCLLNFRRLFSSLVRQNFAKECEDALNKQINLELNAFYRYLAMAFHFNRCDVAAPGAYRFFKTASDEEHQHAVAIIEYMNKRGGHIKLAPIDSPKQDYESIKEAMLEALNMEKVVNEALLDAHAIASKHNDPNMCDFLESKFLQEQVDGIKQLADYITQIETSECELSNYLFDKYLLNDSRSMHKK